jgi:hypothetical protein
VDAGVLCDILTRVFLIPLGVKSLRILNSLKGCAENVASQVLRVRVCVCVCLCVCVCVCVCVCTRMLR